MPDARSEKRDAVFDQTRPNTKKVEKNSDFANLQLVIVASDDPGVFKALLTNSVDVNVKLDL